MLQAFALFFPVQVPVLPVIFIAFVLSTIHASAAAHEEKPMAADI